MLFFSLSLLGAALVEMNSFVSLPIAGRLSLAVILLLAAFGVHCDPYASRLTTLKYIA